VAREPGAFDLVILADVIHHVPLALRVGILGSARAALAPAGRMVFKDWARHATPIHLACALSDRYLTGDEVKALLAAPDPATRRGLRDTVLLSTLYDTAARVQEICDLNTADVRAARPMLVTLHGKGSKTRRVPLMDPTARLIEDYLDRRAPHRGVGTDADPLFNGPEQTRLTRWGVTKILARHVQSLRRRDPDYAPGLNITPHVIRRTRAMHLLQAKVNLIYIRDLLGHADISTTEIYARADAEAKRKAIESAYQSLTPEPLPNWTADQDLLEWLDHVCE